MSQFEKPLVDRPHALYVNGELVAIVTNPGPVAGGLVAFIDALDVENGVGVTPLDRIPVQAALEALGVNGVMGKESQDGYQFSVMHLYKAVKDTTGDNRVVISSVQYSGESDTKIKYDLIVQHGTELAASEMRFVRDDHYTDRVDTTDEMLYNREEMQEYERSMGVKSY